MLARGGLFLCGRPSADSAGAAVVAYVRIVIHHDGFFVGVMDYRDVHICDRAVVGEDTVIPIPADESHSDISKAIIHAAIEADVRTPISPVPNIQTATPAPVSWRPEQPNLRRHDPSSWNPIVAIRTIGPVTRGPHVTGSRARRLLVNRQDGRCNSDRNANCYLRLRRGRDGQQRKSEAKQAKGAKVTHAQSPRRSNIKLRARSLRREQRSSRRCTESGLGVQEPRTTVKEFLRPLKEGGFCCVVSTLIKHRQRGIVAELS